ncbi:hypothetical protein ACQPZP_04950 [Spirillospora sp. CA-142024]|uniref:hypothetical protein n=1 Tax=Spirillospora sp. CA-142024 TaxID=3240036 RepID=UPI003D9034F2
MRNTGEQGTTISLPSPSTPRLLLRPASPPGTRVVRLSWFDSLPSGLLTAIHADGRRLGLFTVPVPVETGTVSPRETSSPADQPVGPSSDRPGTALPPTCDRRSP